MKLASKVSTELAVKEEKVCEFNFLNLISSGYYFQWSITMVNPDIHQKKII